MSSANVKMLRDFHPPETEGVHYRILCMTGKNKGIAYYLISNRVIMGRGDKSDIQVLDSKSSREHAELIFNQGKYIITDLGSQNGLVVNDLKINQHGLSDGDNIIIGATVFKFNVYDIKKNPLQLVEDEDDEDDEDEIYEEEQKLLERKKRIKKRKINDGSDGSRKRMLIVIVVGLLLFIFLDEEKPKKKNVPVKEKNEKKTIASLTSRIQGQSEESREVQQKLDAIIHRGLREFRERNYFRAIRQFELALLASPNNGKASYHLERSKQRLDEEIEAAFLKARREADGLKYESARISYCSIIRLLQSHKEDERYKDAMKNLRIIEKEMGKFKNEIKCF